MIGLIDTMHKIEEETLIKIEELQDDLHQRLTMAGLMYLGDDATEEERIRRKLEIKEIDKKINRLFTRMYIDQKEILNKKIRNL